MAETATIRAEDRRQRLLEAAERCFIASGFHGARMAQIAKEARMSPGHIYHYFDSKEEIIAEMVRAHVDEKQCMLERFEAAGDKVVDRMVEDLKESVDSSTDPFWSALMLEITAEATRNPEIAEMLRTVNVEMKARVLNCLKGALDQPDIDARLEIFIALLQGLGIRSIVNPAFDKAALLPLIEDIVEKLFRPAAGAQEGAAV